MIVVRQDVVAGNAQGEDLAQGRIYRLFLSQFRFTQENANQQTDSLSVRSV